MPVVQSVAKIQECLVDHGAIGFAMQYEKGTGRISSLHFRIDVKGQNISFSLPVNWKKFQECLKRDNVSRWNEDDYCYRVAWANLRDWVASQMALLETEMVELPQVFLPFAVGQNGQTLYDTVLEGQFLLGEGTK